jgi:hypothetical protein
MLLPKYQKGKLTIPSGAKMPYVSLGEGPIPFVVIPGAGDLPLQLTLMLTRIL